MSNTSDNRIPVQFFKGKPSTPMEGGFYLIENTDTVSYSLYYGNKDTFLPLSNAILLSNGEKNTYNSNVDMAYDFSTNSLIFTEHTDEGDKKQALDGNKYYSLITGLFAKKDEENNNKLTLKQSLYKFNSVTNNAEDVTGTITDIDGNVIPFNESIEVDLDDFSALRWRVLE